MKVKETLPIVVTYFASYILLVFTKVEINNLKIYLSNSYL